MTSDQLRSAIKRRLCIVFGHDWDMVPPWTGKELRYNPECQRCGHEPQDIRIVGGQTKDHRRPIKQ